MKLRQPQPLVEVALVAHGQLVLQDQFEELQVREPVGGRLLEAHFDGLAEPGEPELAQRGEQGLVHGEENASRR
jgi:hypothetical protein